mmetsp:Transcript_126643/g.405474  ORF Transcript_126643/g.405474 Transcript_126643/m.405474 type:complete len:298 (-) Transcript_126643:397-1290(-)
MHRGGILDCAGRSGCFWQPGTRCLCSSRYSRGVARKLRGGRRADLAAPRLGGVGPGPAGRLQAFVRRRGRGCEEAVPDALLSSRCAGKVLRSPECPQPAHVGGPWAEPLRQRCARTRRSLARRSCGTEDRAGRDRGLHSVRVLVGPPRRRRGPLGRRRLSPALPPPAAQAVHHRLVAKGGAGSHPHLRLTLGGALSAGGPGSSTSRARDTRRAAHGMSSSSAREALRPLLPVVVRAGPGGRHRARVRALLQLPPRRGGCSARAGRGRSWRCPIPRILVGVGFAAPHLAGCVDLRLPT